MLAMLKNIVDGWANYTWESKEVRRLAEARAMKCAECPMANWGMIAQFLDDEVKQIQGLKCSVCDCPLSTKLRAKSEVCPMNQW